MSVVLPTGTQPYLGLVWRVQYTSGLTTVTTYFSTAAGAAAFSTGKTSPTTTQMVAAFGLTPLVWSTVNTNPITFPTSAALLTTTNITITS